MSGGRSAAVVDGELHHWSPSQISKFRLCNRRWYANKVLGLSEPTSPAMLLGSKLHKQLEDYVDTGVIPEHPLAALCAENTQRTGRLLLTEQAMVDPPLLAAGVPVEGYIDLLDLTDPKRVGVYDYKTRSDLRYALTPEGLATDVQMNTYARWVLTRWPATDAVDLTHVYLRTRGKPAVKSVTVTVTPSDVAGQYQGIEDTVRAMSACARTSELGDVQPNWDACFEWHRPCPYMRECALARSKFTPPPHVLEELSTMSLAEKAAAHRNATAARATGINPPDAATHTTPPVAGATESTQAPTAGTTTATGSISGELIIFVDCQPTKGMDGVAVVRLEDEIAARSAEILSAVATGKMWLDNLTAAQAAELVDLREVKFGTGTAALVANFKRNPPRGLVLASNVGMGSNVIEALSSLPGAVVIRALR